MRSRRLGPVVALLAVGISASACGGSQAATAQSVSAIFDQGKVSMDNAQGSSNAAQTAAAVSIFNKMVSQLQQLSFSGTAQADVQVVIASMKTLVADTTSAAANDPLSTTIGTDAKEVLSADNALRADFGLSPVTSPP